jgi:hypothetical protein
MNVEVLDETYDGEYYTLYLNSNYDISDIDTILLSLNLSFKQKCFGKDVINMRANEIIELQSVWHRVSTHNDKTYEMMNVALVESTPGNSSRIIYDILMPKWVSTKNVKQIKTKLKSSRHVSKEDIVDVEYEEVKRK